MHSHFKAYLDALGNDGWFYRKPLSVGIRYGKLPLGINKLEGLMKEMCQKAGLVGNDINHSGKRSCATSLYKAGLDEQSIMDRTGHRSTAIRGYKSKTDEMEQKVSEVLNPPKSSERDLKVAAAGTPLETERSVSITQKIQRIQRSVLNCATVLMYIITQTEIPLKDHVWLISQRD